MERHEIAPTGVGGKSMVLPSTREAIYIEVVRNFGNLERALRSNTLDVDKMSNAEETHLIFDTKNGLNIADMDH